MKVMGDYQKGKRAPRGAFEIKPGGVPQRSKPAAKPPVPHGVAEFESHKAVRANRPAGR